MFYDRATSCTVARRGELRHPELHWGFRLVLISQILGKYRNKHVLNSYNLWIQCIRENIDNAANGDDQNMILSFGIFDQKTVTILYVFISIFTRYLG